MQKKKLMKIFAGLLVITMVSSTGMVSVYAENTVNSEMERSTSEVPQNNQTNTEETKAVFTETKQQSGKIQYLSDLQEVSKQVGYGSFGKDKNTENKQDGLQVKIRGEKVTFSKGIFAHAPSTVVYDVSGIKEKYPNFAGYLGVDSRSGGGNGVKFKISVSDDKNTWEEIYHSDVVTMNESVYVNLSMKGKKYIKLEAENNGENARDHVVYADAGFVTTDYSPTEKYTAPIKTVAQYDEELSKVNYKDKNAVNNNTQKIYQRELVNQAGFYTINKVYEMKDEQGKSLYADAIKYLLNDSEALYYYINGGPKPSEGTYENSLIAFGKLYNAYKNELDDKSENDFNIRLAVSVASAYANPKTVRFWTGNDNPNSGVEAVQKEDPVRRYKTYKELSKKGGYMDKIAELAKEPSRKMESASWSGKQFRELSVPMMRWVVDSRMHEDEFEWLAQYITDWAKQEGNQNKNFLDSYMYVHNKKNNWQYTDEKYYSQDKRAEWNKKYKFDDFNSFDANAKYGTKDLIRSWIVWEEGGVCGAYAKTYANLAEVAGRPSIVTGQPAHAAALTWQWVQGAGPDHKGQYEWGIQNNAWSLRETSSEYSDYILGWGNRRKLGDIDTNRNRASSYTLLATDVIQNWDSYVMAKKYTLLANSLKDFSSKREAYYMALNESPRFLDATYGMLDLYLNKQDVTSGELNYFVKETASRYTYYPMVMADLMREVELSGKLTNPVHMAELYMERQRALEEAYTLRKDGKDLTAEDYEKTRQPWYAGDVARAILEKDHSRIAAFSFDGEKAGKIVLTEKLRGKGLKVKYSLDGGKTWKISAQDEIQLTNDEIKSITAENDIQVTVEGASEDMYGCLPICKIDIMEQAAPKNIEVNDNEDLLLGDVSNLEYSETGKNDWKPYEQNGLKNKIRFSGEKKVTVRKTAHGQYVASEPAEYQFKNATDQEKEKYLQLQYVSLHEFSSQQNDGGQAAKNLIDGQRNTNWHSQYNITDKKEYAVKFDKARKISKLEYVPSAGGSNGRWQEVEVYGSNDGKTWTKISGPVTLANNTDAKEIKLDSSKAWQYIKVKGLHSYSHDGNADKYFSGSTLNFFEDTTK